MEIILQSEAPPLRQDASGALRVGHSRVLVELVVRAFQGGATPEAIAQRYPTATLADIYAVIAYYLRHRERIEGRQGHLADLRDRMPARQRSVGE